MSSGGPFKETLFADDVDVHFGRRAEGYESVGRHDLRGVPAESGMEAEPVGVPGFVTRVVVHSVVLLRMVTGGLAVSLAGPFLDDTVVPMSAAITL